MKKMFLALIIPVLACATAFAADVNGKWKAEFDTPIGVQHYVYDLHADGTHLTGTAKNDNGTTELKEGKIDGDTVTFLETLSFDGNTIRIAYTGKVSGDQIKFTRQVGEFGSEDLVATREK